MQRALIDKIVKATGVQAGETILIHFWGEDADVGLMHDFASAVAGLGATPLELQQSRKGNYERFSALTRQPDSDAYFERFKNLDGVIDVFNHRPVVLDRQLEEAQLGLYRQYMASLFRALMSAKRFSQIRLPSEENAIESGLLPQEFRERMLAAYDVDYDEIRKTGLERADELARSTSVTLRTGCDCRLNLSLEGRTWHVDAGDGDMPCGEVYIAPVEERTNGEVYFEKLFAEELGVYEKIVLRIQNGVIEKSGDSRFDEQLAKLSQADKTIGELGFGINPSIKSLCGYIALDEKAQDTFHIAMGANTMFGGKNESAVHMDLVGRAEILLQHAG
ncbi:MAG: aminopeptidase [Clostridiales bacterium]|nr:aminopeptidase [Clostridiales bacterium]